MATTAKRYGLPYKGSKNAIAPWVIDHIPPATTLYDLFCGGCAITHAALLSGKWRKVVANDIDGDMPRFFLHCANGGMRGENRWISREDFFRLKDTDPYVRLCWSFGNNQKCYLYSKEIEPWKKALHYARVFGDTEQLKEMGINIPNADRATIVANKEEIKARYIKWWLSKQQYTAEELDALIERCKGEIKQSEEQLRQYLLNALQASGLTQREVGKRLGTQMEGHYFGRSQWAFPTQEHYDKMRAFMPLLNKDYNEVVGLHRLWEQMQSLQSLQSLESLERLERLQRLQRLQSLQTSSQSYDEVPIPDPENSVLYCDVPYSGKEQKQYRMLGEEGFDSLKFYDWCERQKALTIISEYDLPRDRFTCVGEVTKTSLASGTGAIQCVERLFTPNHQAEEYRHRMGRLF